MTGRDPSPLMHRAIKLTRRGELCSGPGSVSSAELGHRGHACRAQHPTLTPAIDRCPEKVHDGLIREASQREKTRRCADLTHGPKVLRHQAGASVEPHPAILFHLPAKEFNFTFLRKNVHPLQGAISWASAAAGLPCEAPLSFCAKAGRGSRLNPRQVCAAFTYLHRIRLDVERDPGPIATPHFRRSTANSSRHAARRGC